MFYMSITLLLEEEFQQLQQSFMQKHYLEFEDSDENKLSYTPIFNEYVSCWASLCGLTLTLIYGTLSKSNTQLPSGMQQSFVYNFKLQLYQIKLV